MRLPGAWAPLLLGLAVLGSPLAPRAPGQDGTCGDGDKEYYDARLGTCCSRCPPGAFVSLECSSTRDTACAPCPEHSFTEHWNHVRQCQMCRPCDPVLGFEETAPCNSTHQSRCRCQPGTVCLSWNAVCLHCQPPPECPPGTEGAGTGELQEGKPPCLPCKAGFFQNASSRDARCQPHTSCEDRGLLEAAPGTPQSDRTCVSRAPPDGGPGSALTALALLAVLAVVSSLACACAWRSHPTLCRKLGSLLKRRPQAEDFSGPGPRLTPPVPDLVKPLLPDPEAGPPAPPGVPRAPAVEAVSLQQQCPLGAPQEAPAEPGEHSLAAMGAPGIDARGGWVSVTGNIYIYNGPVLGAARAPRAEAEPPFPTPEEGPPAPAQEDGKAWHLAESETRGAGGE